MIDYLYRVRGEGGENVFAEEEHIYASQSYSTVKGGTPQSSLPRLVPALLATAGNPSLNVQKNVQ